MDVLKILGGSKKNTPIKIPPSFFHQFFTQFLPALAAQYLHWSVTEWLVIHHSEQSTRQCAHIWSDSHQLAYTSKLKVIWDQTTSNFLVYNFQLPHTTSNFLLAAMVIMALMVMVIMVIMVVIVVMLDMVFLVIRTSGQDRTGQDRTGQDKNDI